MNQEIEITFKKGTRIEQIERSCFYLFSIFSALDSDPISDEHPLPSNAIADFSHIGAAFTDSIYRNISDFIEPEENKQLKREFIEIKPIEDESDEFADISEIDYLSVSLSRILNNANLPITLYNAFQNALAEVYSSGDNDTLNSFESSPEFIKAVIEASKQDES